LFTVRRALKTHWNLHRLDWTQLVRCEHPVTLDSDWTGLDSTRLCWCVRTLRHAEHCDNCGFPPYQILEGSLVSDLLVFM